MVERCEKCGGNIRYDMNGKPYHFLSNEDRCPTDDEVGRYKAFSRVRNEFASDRDLVQALIDCRQDLEYASRELTKIGRIRDAYISALESVLDADSLGEAISLAGGALDGTE